MQSLRTALMAVLVMFVFRNALGQAIHVPDERPTITLGIAAAVPNQNWVVVSNADQYDPSVPYSEVITMVSGVAVLAAEGETPIIDAGNLATTAVTWPATASSNTRLEGFTVRGGTQKVLYVRDQGVVRDCVIDNEGTAGLTKGIESSGNTIIDGCTVTMSGNQVNYGISQSADEDWATIIDCNVTVTGDQDNDSGISFSGGSPNIVNCTVDVARGTGIYISCPTSTTLGNLQGCSVSMGYGFGVYLLNGDITVSDVNVNFYHSDYYNAGITCGSGSGTSRIDVGNCLVSVPGGVGVFVLDDYANVHNVTVDNVGTGFVCDNDVDPTITGCIVTDYTDSYAFEGVNAVYCIGDGTTPYGSGTQGTGSVIQDPLYCNESAGEYTLRVDSYGNPGVNDNLLIGAFPVACMFGTLARTCEFEGNGTLYVPGDVTVPSQKTLTLNDATVLKIRTADSLGIGSDDDKVELVVSSGGTLNISGSGGNPVVLTSDDAPPAEGDWWGIMVNSGGAAHIDYAHIEYSDYGVRYLSSTSGNISHSLFGYNTNYDIAAGSGTGAMALTIDADTIGVGGGKGIDLASYVRGLTIQNTRIIGDSPPVYSTGPNLF